MSSGVIGRRVGMADSLVARLGFGHARSACPRVVPDRLVIAPEVADALAESRPVVALESTLISHGLPYPQNIEVATASEAAVRETAGAVPATVAVHDGRILVGLDAAALDALATAPAGSVRKAARPSLAIALAEGGWAATTVSATMIAASRRRDPRASRPAASAACIAARSMRPPARPASLDISSDLEELGRTAMAVVCAGPKAILDVPATLEYLETRGVPVISVGQAEVPGFFARSSGIKAPAVAARRGRRGTHRRRASRPRPGERRTRVRAGAGGRGTP